MRSIWCESRVERHCRSEGSQRQGVLRDEAPQDDGAFGMTACRGIWASAREGEPQRLKPDLFRQRFRHD
jgi:hypothetical protein